MEKHSVSRLSYLFAHLRLLSSYSFSSDLLSSNLPLLSASALLCFSSVHIVGSLTSKLPSMNTIEHILHVMKPHMKPTASTAQSAINHLTRDSPQQQHIGLSGRMPKEAWRTHPQGGQKPVNEQKHTKLLKISFRFPLIPFDSHRFSFFLLLLRSFRYLMVSYSL